MAIDYEFSVCVLEKELNHAGADACARRHHDACLAIVGTRMDRIESGLERAEGLMVQLTAAQLVTEQKLQVLSDLMPRDRSNGTH